MVLILNFFKLIYVYSYCRWFFLMGFIFLLLLTIFMIIGISVCVELFIFSFSIFKIVVWY